MIQFHLDDERDGNEISSSFVEERERERKREEKNGGDFIPLHDGYCMYVNNNNKASTMERFNIRKRINKNGMDSFIYGKFKRKQEIRKKCKLHDMQKTI